MARVKILPALASPANIAYVPLQMFYWMPVAAFVISLPVLFIPLVTDLWMLVLILTALGWCGAWALAFRKNPHVYSLLIAKYKCGCFRFQRTKNIRPEKGNKYAA